VAGRDLVAERLRAALTLDVMATPHGVDMSPRAVAARLRDACEMSSVCLELGRLNPAAQEPSRAAEPSEPT
jgi:hypothetical protein